MTFALKIFPLTDIIAAAIRKLNEDDNYTYYV